MDTLNIAKIWMIRPKKDHILERQFQDLRKARGEAKRRAEKFRHVEQIWELVGESDPQGNFYHTTSIEVIGHEKETKETL